MNITLEVSVLRDAMSRAAEVTPGRTSIPAAATVRLTAGKDGSVIVETTDMDRWLTQTIAAAHVAKPGTLVIDAVRLRDIARGLPDGGQIVIEAGDSVARIKSGRSRMRIASLPADEFPIYSPEGDPAATFTLPARELRRILATTLPSVSVEETRYYLCGVCLFADGALLAVATNGHTLLRAGTDLPEGAGGLPGGGIILPTITVRHMVKWLDLDTPIEVSVRPHAITVAGEDWCYISRLIDGTYPDYKRVVPREDTLTDGAAVSATEISAAAQRVAAQVQRTKGDHGYRRDILIRMTADTVDLGAHGDTVSAIERVDATVADGAKLNCAINADYLLMMVEACGDGTMTVRPSAGEGPIICVPPDADDRHISLVMPTRGSWPPALDALDDDGEA